MRQNFNQRITVDGSAILAVIIPEHRKDGMYYEINIKGYPRFYMRWSTSDRFDVVPGDYFVPYELALAVSDAIEEQTRK
jgi:hypothetical protein